MTWQPDHITVIETSGATVAELEQIDRAIETAHEAINAARRERGEPLTGCLIRGNPLGINRLLAENTALPEPTDRRWSAADRELVATTLPEDQPPEPDPVRQLTEHDAGHPAPVADCQWRPPADGRQRDAARAEVDRLRASHRDEVANLAATAEAVVDRLRADLDAARQWLDLREGELASANAQRDHARARVAQLEQSLAARDRLLDQATRRVAELEQQQERRWELPANIEWQLVRWRCTRCDKRSTWTYGLGDPPSGALADAVADARRHHADHERWAAERLSTTPPETAGGEQ